MNIFVFVFSVEKTLVEILKSNVECHAKTFYPRIPPSVYGIFGVKMHEEKNKLLFHLRLSVSFCKGFS